jgi:cell division protein FtsA
VAEDERIALDLVGEEGDRTADRIEVARIIEARTREILEKLGEQIEKGSNGLRLPAGLVLTGGGALLAGTADLGREVLGLPVRVATPSGVGGLTDGLLSPAYSTSIGLLCWAARVVTAHEPVRYESAPAGGSLGRVRDWFRTLFP